MKKCASCAKDLPDAALHCVFCGAKQAAAPAVQPSVAKTAFGYSANEVMEQLGRPMNQQPARASGLAPTDRSDADAATVLVANAPPAYSPPAPAPYTPPQPAYAPPPAAPYAPPHAAYSPPAASGGMGIHSPPQPTPAPLPTAPPPFLASQTAARAGRPIEPWKDSLRLWMIVWGALALVAFAVPTNVSPLHGRWDQIIDGAGTAKILPLVWAAVGLVALVVGLLPMESLGRGIIALLLGLAGIVTPIVLAEQMPPWQQLAQVGGLVLLVPGLLIRDEYVESTLARILITLGVAAYLVPLLVPAGSQIPLVGVFKALIDAPGEAKIIPALLVVNMVLVVLSLLAWMPGPATGGAKVFAWLLLLFPVVEAAIAIALDGHVGEMISHAPAMLVAWVPGVAYAVLASYGLATAIGKRLE